VTEITALRITNIIERWDMRGVHKLRTGRPARSLKRGQCLIAFNKAMTIGRIIDEAGGVHTYYAEPRESFDIDSLSALVHRGFWIELRVGQTARAKAAELKHAA
jgi:hypothetical protein